jgi:hypothetical protein
MTSVGWHKSQRYMEAGGEKIYIEKEQKKAELGL